MVQQGLRATSKSSLKLQCLFCAKGDLKEAKELYDFFASDMPDLPDQDPVPSAYVVFVYHIQTYHIAVNLSFWK